MSKMLLPRVSTLNALLFVCDIQERFRPLIYRMPSVIHNTNLLTQSCNILNVPIIITEQYPKALGHTVQDLIRYPNNEIYVKSKFSMLTDEVLESVRTNHGSRNQVILCGIESHVCVMQTALDCLSNGLNVHIVCDAVSSQSSYDRAVALEKLKSVGCTLTTSESIVFEMMRDAQHPQFREISTLLKNHKNSGVSEFQHDTNI